MSDDLTLGQILQVLEQQYPPQTAAGWDRVGLVTGDPDQPVERIHFAVDPTLEVIQEAVDNHADLLITHHPLLLRGIHSVAITGAKGAAVTALVLGDLALYCAHTNADVACPGVSDALADACGLLTTEPLAFEDGQPVGRVGELAEPVRLRDFATALARALPPAPVGLRVSGDPNGVVSRVACLGGAGDDRFEEVRRSGADVYVTADLRHHPALEAREEARGGTPFLIDAGHWATEWLWLKGAAERLVADLGPAGNTIETHICTLRTDPWDFLVSTEDEEPRP